MSANADSVCVTILRHINSAEVSGTKYSKMDHVKFLKAVFHNF